MPKISVIIPTYNREKTIASSIKSVLNQTFQDFEIIVIDDGSRDQTIEVVRNYQKKDKRIKLFCLNKNSGGPVEPRNIGIENSQGEYIAFLDSDDLYLPDNLRIKSEILDKNNQVEIVSGFSWVVENTSKKIVDYWFFSPSNWLVRKKVFKEVGVFKKEQNSSDEMGWILRYRILKGIFRECLIKEPLIVYRWHKDQLTKLFFQKEKAILKAKILKSLIEDINELRIFKKDQAIILSKAGNFYCLGGEIKKGREAFLESLNMHFNWFSLFLFLFSFIGGGKYYKKIEKFLRFFYQNLIWHSRKFLASLRYRNSYKIALNIINNFI